MKLSRGALIGIGVVLGMLHSVLAFWLTTGSLQNPSGSLALWLLIVLDLPVALPLFVLAELPGVGSVMDDRSGILFAGLYLGVVGGVWWFLVPMLLRWALGMLGQTDGPGMQRFLAVAFVLGLAIGCVLTLGGAALTALGTLFALVGP